MKAASPASFQTHPSADKSLLFWNGWDKPVNERGLFKRGGQSPLGKRLRIATDAGGFHEFVYNAPVCQNMAELCARIGAAIPTISAKVVPVMYGNIELVIRKGAFPTFAKGVWLPERCEIKLESLSVGAGAYIEVLEGSTLGELLGLTPGLKAIGAENVELVRGTQSNAEADRRFGVMSANFQNVANTLASIQASLGNVITNAANAASHVASSTIEAVLASYRAQINGSSSLRESASNEVNGSLVHIASGGASTGFGDLDAARLSQGAIGDLLSFEAVLNVATIAQAAAFKVVVVEGEGLASAAAFDVVGAVQTVNAGQTNARVVLVGSRRLTIGKPVSIYVQGRTTVSGGSFTTTDGRIQARLDRAITI